jgi:hypothetical protein
LFCSRPVDDAPRESNNFTSSSVVCENCSYQRPPAFNGSGIETHTTSSAIRPRRAQVSFGTHRHGDHDARRPLLPKRKNGRLHRRAGRQAIVHEDDVAIANDG